ncbi:hypothetical protein KY343_00215 [Candidatus Woesearchaeota archaeon]|nr:hypothetical protein [Candidatus Woesearchaeota archaeon]
MATATIIGLILIVILIVLVIKFVKNIMKSIIIIISILVILSLLGSSFVYLDINDFKEKFPVLPSLYLLEKDDKIVAGIFGAKIYSYIPEEQLNSYQQNFEENKLEEIKSNHYKLFIININAFDSVTDIQIEQDGSLSKEEVDDLLDSSTPIEDFMAINNIPEQDKEILMNDFKIDDEAEFKALLFYRLFDEATEDGTFFVLKEYKKDNVIVYPKSTIFRLVKELPLSLLNKLIGNLNAGE